MSNSEELVEVFWAANQIEAECIRLLLGSNGIHCVLKCNGGDRIYVMESIAKKAKRVIKEAGMECRSLSQWRRKPRD